jgi:hypothetical protein
VLDSGNEEATSTDLLSPSTFIPMVFYFEHHLKNIITDSLSSMVCIFQHNPRRNQALVELKRTNLIGYLTRLLLESLMLEEEYGAKKLRSIVIKNVLTYGLFKDENYTLVEGYNNKKKFYPREITDLQGDILMLFFYCCSGPKEIGAWAVDVGIVSCMVRFLEKCTASVVKRQKESDEGKTGFFFILFFFFFFFYLFIYFFFFFFF